MQNEFTIYLVGTADQVSVDPPSHRMGGAVARQTPHSTLLEAMRYKNGIQGAFSVPLVIREGVLRLPQNSGAVTQPVSSSTPQPPSGSPSAPGTAR
jgi:hypothetical protein